MQAAGISVEELLADGLGPVNLETTIRFRNELRAGDEIDVSCSWHWGTGKTFRVEHELRRHDGEVAAEVSHISDLLNLEARRLVSDPQGVLRRRATRPDLLGIRAE
jgi:acyl-CoA thioester hydrolase